VNADERHAAAVAFERGDRILAARRPQDALPYLREASLIDPDNLLYRRARRLAQRDRFRSKSGGPWVGMQTAFARLRLQRALRRRDWQAIPVRAEEVLDLDVRVALAHEAVATDFEKRGMIDLAVWALEEALLCCPATASFQDRLHALYLRRGSFAQAAELLREPLSGDVAVRVDELEKEIESNPTETAPYIQLAEVVAAAGYSLKARARLQEGLMATRNSHEISMAIGKIELDAFRSDLATIEQMLQQQPADTNLQVMHRRLSREVLAREIDEWRHRSQRFPAEAIYRLELGVRLLRAGQFDEAIELFLALRGVPELAGRALLYAAYCHLNRKQTQKAAALLHEALVALGSDTSATKKEVLFLLAQHAVSVENLTEATAHVEELLRIDSQYKNVDELAAQLRQKLHKPSQLS
jgi:tetratricopeptide (TPR) repeat protein